MLTSVQSLMGTRKVGVLDTEKGIMVIPLDYAAVYFQKYGIICQKFDGFCDVFRFNGTHIMQGALNPLLVNDNYLIASDASGKCYIFDYSKEMPALIGSKHGFDSVLVFIGSNTEPTMYTSKLNLAPLFVNSDYRQYGVSFDRYICAVRNGYWGVIHRDTKQIVVNFNATTVCQKKNSQLAVTDLNGQVKLL